jgi:flagellar basal-body rod protein FlgC
MELQNSMAISAAALRAQGMRMRIIAENLANQDSVASQPGDTPYRRKLVTFDNVLNRELGVEMVQVSRVITDNAPFGSRFEPGHPGSNADGYLSTTNVEGMVESMDMRAAQRVYESNITAIEASKKMMLQTIELLR